MPSVTAGPTVASSAEWVNPNNALTDDGTFSSSPNAGTNPAPIILTGFGFALPTGATVTGLTVTVIKGLWRPSIVTDPGTPYVVAVSFTEDGSSRVAGGVSVEMTSGPAIIADYGPLSPGATGITAADVNASTFGVIVDMPGAGGARSIVGLDYLNITVDYTDPATGTIWDEIMQITPNTFIRYF